MPLELRNPGKARREKQKPPIRGGTPPLATTRDTAASVNRVFARGILKNAQDEERQAPVTVEKKRSRLRIAPGEVAAPKAVNIRAIFRDRKTADAWMRERLARQAADYDTLIAQLQADLAASTRAMKGYSDAGQPVPAELLRNRQSVLTSMRTIMAGQQEMMTSLMKSRNLLDDLGDAAGGGDVHITFVPRPPPQTLNHQDTKTPREAEAAAEAEAREDTRAPGEAEAGAEG